MRTLFEDPFTGKWTISGDSREYTKAEAEALQKLILKDEELFIVRWSEPPFEEYKERLKQNEKLYEETDQREQTGD